ncbi:hypothetical protein [Erysipelothrix larvae]|nr:hypothetical protein [Erysipelothrix larvae]
MNQLKTLAERFSLPYDPKNLMDYLTLTVFEEGLRNKETIESCYESVRSQCFDMWDYLSFKERNALILKDLKPELQNLKHFSYNNEQIFIPFFDELMNALYSKEVAILELPQFFELYQNFKSKIININRYGRLPFIANMGEFECSFDTKDFFILHDERGKAFIKVSDKDYDIFPYLKTKDLMQRDIFTFSLLLAEDEDAFYKALVDKEVVSKRFIKKYNKLVKKRQKKVKS